MPSPFLLSRPENKEPASGIFCPPIFERREEPRQILIIFSQGSFYLYSKSNSGLSIRSKRKITRRAGRGSNLSAACPSTWQELMGKNYFY
jgi:hypothetical protein